MIFWIDAQLSPALAPWLEASFPVTAKALRDLGLRDADDAEIFRAAHAADAIIITKDSDFVDLLRRFGAPPSIIWVLRQHEQCESEGPAVEGDSRRLEDGRSRGDIDRSR
jgi:predicted nuclease of predicted toxin-antitoxin system